MQYALVNDTRSEAHKGGRGICELCHREVIAKCGERKIHHWAHQKVQDCDLWWENETDWHRNWKNKFPERFREIPLTDPSSGEIHRADIHTDLGITIEFQHSYIDAFERKSRENFYKNLIWVVDGTRNKRDHTRLLKRNRDFKTLRKGVFRVDAVEAVFPENWISSPVPVVFDFLRNQPDKQISGNGLLYCLLPYKVDRDSIIAELPRTPFINSIVDGQWLSRLDKFSLELKGYDIEIQAQRTLLKMNEKILNLRKRMYRGRTGRKL